MYVHIDCCDGSDEYESGIHCQNTCRNIEDIAKANGGGGGDLSITHLGATNELTSKHAIAREDRVQNNSKDLVWKLRGIAHLDVRFTCFCYITICVLDVVSTFPLIFSCMQD